MSVPVPPGWREEMRAGLHTCHYCFAAARSWDHIVPVSLGGSNYPSNLQPACEECNKAKAGSLPTCRCRRCQRALSWWRRHLPEERRRQLHDRLGAQIDALTALQVGLKAHGLR